MKLIGFVSIDEKGEPVRKPRSGYGFQTQDQRGYHPPRIYSRVEMANKNSPVRQSREVFLKEDGDA